VEISLLADRIKVERAVNPQAQRMRELLPRAEMIASMIIGIPEDVQGVERRKRYDNVAVDFSFLVSELDFIFQSKSFADGRQLFDGILDYEISLLENALDGIKGISNGLAFPEEPSSDEDHHRHSEFLDRHAEHIEKFIHTCVGKLRIIPPRMEAIRDLYLRGKLDAFA
jgi:hypothetical protein